MVGKEKEFAKRMGVTLGFLTWIGIASLLPLSAAKAQATGPGDIPTIPTTPVVLTFTCGTGTFRATRANGNLFCQNIPGFYPPGGGTQPNPGATGTNGTGPGKENPATLTDCITNPIIPATGNKIEPEFDFGTAEEAGLLLTRTYNHFWNGTGLFGKNWISSLDYKLVNGNGIIANNCNGTSAECTIGSNRSIQAWRPDGRTILFYADTLNDHVNFHEDKAGAIAKIVVQTNGNAILYGEDHSVETYAPDGKVISVKNEQGIGWTYTYTNGLPTKVTHTSGRYIQLTWTGPSLTSVRDPAANVHGYAYAGGKLISVTKPGLPATTITYHYELGSDPYALTGKSFNGIRYSTFTYDSSGHAASSEHNGFAKYTFVYTDGTDGALTVLQTNPYGKKTTLVYKNGQHQSVAGAASTYCPATASSSQYDVNGYPSQQSDFNGNVTTFKYDAYGHMTEQVEASGKPEARKSTWVWDIPNNRVSSETVGGVMAGSELFRVTYSYTIDGRIATIVTTDLTDVALPTHSVAYSYTEYANGMLQTMKIDGPLPGTDDAITYNYSATGDLTSTKDSLGQGATYSLINGLGLPGRSTNANGANTDYTYDAQGRVTNVRTYLDGTTQDYTTIYDAFGNVIEKDMPDGQVQVLRYGANKDWLYAVEEPMQPLLSGDTWQGVEVARTAAGDVFSRTTYVLRPQLGIPCSPSPCMELQAVSPLDTESVTTGLSESNQVSLQTVTTTYIQDIKTKSYTDLDELGRPRAQRGNNGQNLRYGYDLNGNVITITDSLNKVTTLTYDALDRVHTSKDPRNGITTFGYDVANRLVKVTDPRGKITTYDYNGFGQPQSVSSPDTGVTSFVYDVYGRRNSMTESDGQLTTYSYDSLGRLTKITAGGPFQQFTYDTCTNGKQLLCTVTDHTGSVSYTYTPEGLRASQASVMPAGGLGNVSYDYDTMGRLTGVTYPNGNSVRYGYAYSKPTTMTTTVSGVTSNIVTLTKYLPFGPTTGWTYGNALTLGRNYDLDGRLTGMSTSSSGSVLQSLTYGYNANDVITTITNGLNVGLTQNYGYDELSRLTSVTATNADQALTYDASGNRATHTWAGLVDTYNTSTTSNRLTSISGSRPKSFTLDATGNIAVGAGITYGYNTFNRLESATKAGVTTTYAVNALGERIYKKVGAINYWFIYGPNGELLSEYKTGQGWTNYLGFNSEPVAMVRSGQISYIHNDHLGRPELVTNSTKAAIWRASNFAFDRTVTLDSLGGLNLGFPGQYYDAETGNWNNGFRDYDASIGRYLESDPIGLLGGLNTYAYAEGNPVLKFDRTGLSSLCFDRASGMMTVYDKNGTVIDSYPAANNVTKGSKGPWPDGEYDFSHYNGHPESGKAGPYGSHGIFVFDVPGRSGMGVHSGRKGPQSKTLGCIRTSDDDMGKLNEVNNTDPLQSIKVGSCTGP